MITLGKRDSREAERLAVVLIDRLRESSISPVALLNLSAFIFMEGRSLEIQTYYLQAMAARLRRDLRLDAQVGELNNNLQVARDMVSIVAHSPNWQIEFQGIASSFEAIFRERGIALPGEPRCRMMDISTVS